MKKALLTLMCMTAMLAASTGLKTQEVTIVLNPGWTWMSCPSTEAMDFATALGDFTPMQGDVIKSQWGQATYINGQWRGSISQFVPGYGYHYKSNRTVPVMVTFNAQQPAPQVVVTTSEPMLITAISAMGGGEVTTNDGNYVAIIVRGICWGVNPNPTLNDNYVEAAGGIGSFAASMTNLNISTTYYVRAFAVTTDGTAYGEEKTFTTRDGVAVVTTAELTEISLTTATCGGMVTDDGGLEVTVRGVCWSTGSNPTIADLHSTNGSGTGSFSITLTGLIPNTTYYVRAYATNNLMTVYGSELSFTTSNPTYVDLGLPSGLLWATCNLGADTPEDYGDYFAWGETQPKEIYDWSTYQYCNGSHYTMTKYCTNSSYGNNGFTDNLTTLLPEDDAATANWGSDWRMPTEAEFQELLDNTTVTWTTQNGINGRLFTAPNGNSLFLPAAGEHGSSGLFGAGIHDRYVSSSLSTGSPNCAWILFFNSETYGMSYNGRNYGRPIRAVRSTPQNTSFIINAIANPSESGEVSGGRSYQAGAECTLTATANEGYTFTNWTENDSVVSTDSIYTFIVTGARNLVANFEATPTVNVYAWVSTKKIIADDITPELVISKKFVQVSDTSTGLTYGMAVPENAVSGGGRVLVAIPKSFQYGSITDDLFFNTPTIGDAISHLDTYASNEINLTINGTQVPYVVVESISVPLQGASLDVVFGNVRGSSWEDVWSGTAGRRIPCEVYTNGVLVYPESRTDTQ